MQNGKVGELTKHLEELSNSIVTDPERLAQFVEGWAKGFHQYSLHNMLLIWFQRPDATLCAGYHQWLKQHRFVKKGEHGIAILAPIIKKVEDDDGTEEVVRWFKVVYVFDYAQTDGEPLDLGHSDMVTGKGYGLDKLMAIFPYPVNIEGVQVASGNTDGHAINLTERERKVAMEATYFHELAHIELGHQNGHKEISRGVKELEAEAVSFIVCKYIGIQNDMAGHYIGHWSNKEELGKAGGRILKTAEAIIRKLDGKENDNGTRGNM